MTYSLAKDGYSAEEIERLLDDKIARIDQKNAEIHNLKSQIEKLELTVCDLGISKLQEKLISEPAKTRMACNNNLNLEPKTEDPKMTQQEKSNKDSTRQSYIEMFAEEDGLEKWMVQSGTSQFEAVVIHKVTLDWTLEHVDAHGLKQLKAIARFRVFEKCKHEYPILLCGRNQYGQMIAQVAGAFERDHKTVFDFMGRVHYGVDAAILAETYLRENGVSNYASSNARSFYPDVAFANCDESDLGTFAQILRDSREKYAPAISSHLETCADIDKLQEQKTEIINKIRKRKQHLLNSYWHENEEGFGSQNETEESSWWQPVDIASISNIARLDAEHFNETHIEIYRNTIRILRNPQNLMMHWIPSGLHRFIDKDTPINELYEILDFASGLCALNVGLEACADPMYTVEFPNVSDESKVKAQDYPILINLVPVAKWDSKDYNRLETTRGRSLRKTVCKGFQNASETVRAMLDLCVATDERKHWAMWKAERRLTQFVHTNSFPSEQEIEAKPIQNFFNTFLQITRMISKWETLGCFASDLKRNS